MMFPQDSLHNPDDDMSRGSTSDYLPQGGALVHSTSSASFDAYSTTCTTDMDNASLSSQDVDEDDDGTLSALANDRPPSDYDSGSESDVESIEDADADDELCNEPGVSTSQTTVPTQPGGEKLKSGKRKKTEKGGQKKKKKSKRSFERKNIRKILGDKDLEQNTLTAQQEELERKKRISEFKKNMIAQREAEEKDSHLKSLLDDDQDSDCVVVQSTKRDVVVLSSDEDTKQESSDDEDNSGSHVNDLQNKKNENGQVLVNVGHPDDEPDLFLAPQVAYTVKPHQIGGIRFLYDNLVESLSRLHSSPGFGCILAHSMGLGKTIQVVGFVDVLLRSTDMNKILIIVPINTLQNWVAEFNMWLPLPDVVAGISEEDVLPRRFTLHVVNDTHKTVAARAKVIESWCGKGGVLLMGYEMYRLLSTRKARTRSKPFKLGKNKKPLLIDLDEEDRNQELQIDMQSALLDPGPDLIICDEGHRIKNSHAGISQALKSIRTRRRVVLTGYPLQNNLLEYWCMVDFVRPNFLGTKTEFCNMFERPINNGQCQDSTSKDVQLMRARAHVLHSLLEGFVQRRSHQVLKDALPPKEEYVLLVRMSPVQRVLYRVYMDYLENGLSATESTNPLKAFAVCCKIWNHPDILHQVLQHKHGLIADNDLDLADSESTKSGGDNNKKEKSTDCDLR